MNPETDFDNQQPSTAIGDILSSAFLPLLLLSLSLLSLLIWQLTNLSSQRSNLQATLQRQTEYVLQSRQVQSSLQKIAVELIELAKTDAAAKAVVDKYGIRQQSPSGIPGGAAK